MQQKQQQQEIGDQEAEALCIHSPFNDELMNQT